jgi:hypothetical protein
MPMRHPACGARITTQILRQRRAVHHAMKVFVRNVSKRCYKGIAQEGGCVKGPFS